MPLEDKALRRRVEHEVAKFPVDVSLLNIAVVNHTAYFTGRARIYRRPGVHADPKSQMEHVAEVVRRLPGIREVVLDLIYTT